jgi:curved DNA-binding protein CbpA
MSKIEINFNNLKYNLYELLNIQTNADSIKIKKNFVKVIKNFHPDKNSDLEEEIYYHIILANQILLDNESRKRYDDFISETAPSFKELKTSFTKSINDMNQHFPTKDTSVHSFNNKIDELNKKHGYISNSSESVMDRFNKIKGNRDMYIDQTKIEKETFKNMKEFNSKFDVNKLDGGKFQEQIIEFKGPPLELSSYIVGEQYTSLCDLDKLYVDDSILSSKFTSLDRAFMIQSVSNIDVPNNTVKEKMNDYKKQTDQYNNYKPTDFTTTKFNEWQ